MCVWPLKERVSQIKKKKKGIQKTVTVKKPKFIYLPDLLGPLAPKTTHPRTWTFIQWKASTSTIVWSPDDVWGWGGLGHGLHHAHCSRFTIIPMPILQPNCPHGSSGSFHHAQPQIKALWALYLVSPKGWITQHSRVGELTLHWVNSDQ